MKKGGEWFMIKAYVRLYCRQLLQWRAVMVGKTLYMYYRYTSNQFFHPGTIPGHTVTFSSYPGTLMSGDDYYLISSGMVGLVVKEDWSCILISKCGLGCTCRIMINLDKIVSWMAHNYLKDNQKSRYWPFQLIIKVVSFYITILQRTVHIIAICKILLFIHNSKT